MKRSPIVYFLFLFSGITALIYEVVWARMLTLAFGHTVFSVSIVLASFMAGLGFGSYFSGHAINHIGGKKTQPDSSNLSKEFSEDLESIFSAFNLWLDRDCTIFVVFDCFFNSF